MKLNLIIASILLAQFSFAQDGSNNHIPKIWSLEDCINYALENNITVKNAALNTNIAEVDYDKAKSSRLPNLFGSASQSFSNGNSIDPITSNFVPDQIHSSNVGINSSMTLFQGNQVSNQIKQNKLLLEQSIFQEKVEKNNIVLKQLLKLPPMEDLEIETIDENMDLINTELNKIEVYNKALSILQEIQSSNLNIAANQKELDIAKGGFLPTLSLSGSLGSGYTSINDNTFSDQFNANFNQRLGLSLNIPIFNRNQTKAAVQTATINIEKAEIQLYSTEREIYKKVETAFQNALSAQEQVIAAEASKEAAEQSYTLAQKKYELGDLSTPDLVISQNTFTNA